MRYGKGRTTQGRQLSHKKSEMASVDLMLHEQGRVMLGVSVNLMVLQWLGVGSVRHPTVHSNVHTMETDWPSDRMNEGPTACL